MKYNIRGYIIFHLVVGTGGSSKGAWYLDGEIGVRNTCEVLTLWVDESDCDWGNDFDRGESRLRPT